MTHRYRETRCRSCKLTKSHKEKLITLNCKTNPRKEVTSCPLHCPQRNERDREFSQINSLHLEVLHLKTSHVPSQTKASCDTLPYLELLSNFKLTVSETLSTPRYKDHRDRRTGHLVIGNGKLWCKTFNCLKHC